MRKWLVAVLLAAVSMTFAEEETVSLTLRECIERALAGNLDLSLERINPQIEDANLLAARGDFDPHLQLQANRQHREIPLFKEELAGNRSSEANITVVSPGLTGKLPTGTIYDFSYDATRQATAPAFDIEYRATGTLRLTQPLLRGFWLGPNLAGIRIARKNKEIAVYGLVTTVMDTINEVHKAYYDLIFAIENVKVQQESLELAQALLAENQKRLEVGLMSPLDVTQAESGVALQEEGLIQAQQEVRNQANRLRRLISSDVTPLRQTRLIPVDEPSVEPVTVDVDQSIKLGLQNRPEYLQQKQRIESNRIQLRYDRNQLFPQVDLTASYGQAGLGSSFEQAFDSSAGGTDFPNWLVGVVVDIPLGNLGARGSYRASKLRVQQSILELKNTEQDIIIEVDNAAAQVQTNLKRIDATRAASRLAEETLNAERKKLEAGTTTSYIVLQHQRDLTEARSREIRAIADYNLSLAELYRVEGTLLQKNNITVKAE